MLLALPNYLFVVTYPLLNYTSHSSSTLPSGPPVWESLPWKSVSSVLDLHSQPGEMSIIATSTTISLLKNFRLTDPTKCTPAGPTDTSKADAQTCFPASMSDPASPSHPPGTSGVICDCFFTSTFNRPLNQLTLLILSFMHPSSSSLLLNVILTLGTHYFLPELANWFLCLWYHSVFPRNSPPQPLPLFHLTHQSHQNYLYFSTLSHLHIFMWFLSL